MALKEVLDHIDSEITRLQQARALLVGGETPKVGRGRPKGSKNHASVAVATETASNSKTKRKLSPEGRKAIADAMKRRWEERRKQAPK